MLEQLFGSRTRYKLLKLFLTHPQDKFYMREVSRKTGERINSVRRELFNLEKLGIVKIETNLKAEGKKGKVKKNIKKYYSAEVRFPLFEELKNLLLKSQIVVKNGLLEHLAKIGKVKLLILTGFFVGEKEAPTDILVVGSFKRKKMSQMIKKLEKSLGQELRYTVMSGKEFKFRNDITDKFLYQVLESKKLVVLDELQDRQL